MLVGVDATCWANERGYGRFTRELVRGHGRRRPPAWRFRCFVDAARPCHASTWSPPMSRCLEVYAVGVADHRRRGGRRQPLAHRHAAAHPGGGRPSVRRLLLALGLHLSSRCRRGIRSVVTVHDAIAERFPRPDVAECPGPACSGSAKVSLAAVAGDPGAHRVGVRRRRARRGARRGAVGGCGWRSRRPRRIYRPSTIPPDAIAAVAVASRPAGRGALDHVCRRVQPAQERAPAGPGARPAASPGSATPRPGSCWSARCRAIRSTAPRVRSARPSPKAGTEARVLWPGFVSDEDLRQLHSGARLHAGIALDERRVSVCPRWRPRRAAARSWPPPQARCRSLLAGGGMLRGAVGPRRSHRRHSWLLTTDAGARAAHGRHGAQARAAAVVVAGAAPPRPCARRARGGGPVTRPLRIASLTHLLSPLQLRGRRHRCTAHGPSAGGAGPPGHGHPRHRRLPAA